MLLFAVFMVSTRLHGQAISTGTESVVVSAGLSSTSHAFTFTRTLRGPGAGSLVYDIRFPSPVESTSEANNSVPGELYLPFGMERGQTFPAVVCLHILNGNFELERTICRRLAQRGVIAFFFKLPYYGERGGDTGRQPLANGAAAFTNGLEQGFADTVRAVDILQAMPEVNHAQIGLTGISLGGILSAISCGRDTRVSKAYLTLAGGGIGDIIRNARETRRMREVIGRLPPAEQASVWEYLERIDPVNAGESLGRLAAGGNLRLVCAELDQVVPPAAGLRLAEAAGMPQGITWLKGLDHYSALARLPSVLDEMVEFFGADVPKGWTPPPTVEEKAPIDLLGLFLRGLTAFIGSSPPTEGAHMLGAEVKWKDGERQRTARLEFARGTGNLFRLTGDFPVAGAIGLGQGRFPWLAGANGKVFSGELEPVEGASFTRFITPSQLMRYQVALGALTAAAFAPGALSDYLTIKEQPTQGGRRAITLNIGRKGTSGRLDLTFAGDETPESVTWDIGGVTGVADLTYWRLNSPMDQAWFDAPPGEVRQRVPQDDLQRMIAATAELLLEKTE